MSFQSINHELLKRKIQRRIKDKDALKLVFDLIDSEECGLGIGNMTSQILAIFYLDDFDKFIKEELKIQYYVRYQDDGLFGFVYLGRGKDRKYAKRKSVKRKMKKREFLYRTGRINLNAFISSIQSFRRNR